MENIAIPVTRSQHRSLRYLTADGRIALVRLELLVSGSRDLFAVIGEQTRECYRITARGRIESAG